jgi:cytochrome c553
MTWIPALIAPRGRELVTWKCAASAAGVLWLLVAGAGSYLASRPAVAAGAGTGGHGQPSAMGRDADDDGDDNDDGDEDSKRSPEERLAEGQQIFRFDTFGDEQKWTDTLHMNEVIETAVDPTTALSLGLKVDVDALPAAVQDAIVAGQVDLADPATTLTLIGLNAVVGIVGAVEPVDGQQRLTKVGTTCALCHSTVDDSFAPGIGHRLDGWPNLDLNPGAIIASSPAVPADAKAVYNSWGPGRYDPRFNLDGQSTPVVIPPAYGLEGVKRATYTADGSITYWNKYVAVTQMGGHGSFVDKRIGVRVVQKPDEVKKKLKSLREYQHSLPAPAAPAGSFDAAAADRGRAVFQGAGKCATCHSGPHYTDVNRRIGHRPEEIGMDTAYALRSATKKYRTTPLRGLATHAPYFHDGSAPTLGDVVEHYDSFLHLGLSPAQKLDLVEYLKSL